VQLSASVHALFITIVPCYMLELYSFNSTAVFHDQLRSWEYPALLSLKQVAPIKGCTDVDAQGQSE
jgi:hypothetical protein